jgi:hypothetical protein
MPELAEAPGGLRGIGRMRLGRDLLVAATDGPPRSELERDPAKVANLRLLASFLRSGVEVLLERPPILLWVEPPAVGRGESAEVVVSGLAAAQSGRLLRGETLLGEGRADGDGRLRLATGPLPGDNAQQPSETTILDLVLTADAENNVFWKYPVAVVVNSASPN